MLCSFPRTVIVIKEKGNSAIIGQKFQKINLHFFQFSVCTSSLSHSNFLQVNSCTRVYTVYTQTAKKSVITDHGKYVKYKTKFNFAIFLILPDYRREELEHFSYSYHTFNQTSQQLYFVPWKLKEGTICNGNVDVGCNSLFFNTLFSRSLLHVYTDA